MSKKIKVEPCPKCKSKNIEILDCGYTTFNCGHGKCLDCGHKHSFQLSGMGGDGKREATSVWNKHVKAFKQARINAEWNKAALRLCDGMSTKEMEALPKSFPGWAKSALDSIIVRCEEGDKRCDWIPTIKSIAENALRGGPQGLDDLKKFEELP